VAFFMVVWGGLMLATFGGLALAVAALVSAANLPGEAFGPWWDNAKTPWILGIAVSYMIPFGTLVAGIYWFRTGRRGYRETGTVPRPFWLGPPKPYPPMPMAPYPGPPPAPPPPPPARRA
jgi:hypothetical protein